MKICHSEADATSGDWKNLLSTKILPLILHSWKNAQKSSWDPSLPLRMTKC